MEFKVLNERDCHKYSELISEMGENITYPLGMDNFSISHGADYFTFFKRLGEMYYFLLLDTGKPVCVMAAVLRTINEKNDKAWYICDIKVAPDHQGKGLPAKLLTKIYPIYIKKCSRVYAVVMNSKDNEISRSIKIYNRLPFLKKLKIGATLELYSLSKESLKLIYPILEKTKGGISYLSLKGIKDLVLESTGKAMSILHCQHGWMTKKVFENPKNNTQHMFCTPKGDELSKKLNEMKVETTATASVIQIGMDDWDWSFILTSDI